jgi:hypothetical protein
VNYFMDNKIKIKENLGWGATIIIKSNRAAPLIIRNRISNIALTEIIKALYDDTDLIIKHLAIGTSDKTLSDADTTLDNEIYRVPFVSWAPLGYGQMQALALILGDEPNFAPYNGKVNIREIGFFCGTSSLDWGGGAGKDTGLMLSRILVIKNKQLGEEYQITRNDQIDRR